MLNQSSSKNNTNNNSNTNNDNEPMDEDILDLNFEPEAYPNSRVLSLENKTDSFIDDELRSPVPLPLPQSSRLSIRKKLPEFNPTEVVRQMPFSAESNERLRALRFSICSLPPMVAPKSDCITNEMAVYGWGCADPLLLSSTENVDLIMDEEYDEQKIALTVQSSVIENEILQPHCLIEVDSIEFNFNEIDVRFNGAVVWQRDCNGLWAWGDNEHGSVGKGIENKIRVISCMHAFDEKPVRFVTVGESHTAVILHYGGLLVFGNNENGQCGLTPETLNVKPDEIVPYLADAHICQVVCGSAHTIALARHGTLFSFGNKDTEGLLGRHVSCDQYTHYRPMAIGKMYFFSVIEIAVGDRHTIIRTKYHRLFAWGKNNHCQLGLGDVQSRSIPTEIMFMRNKQMKQIACGRSHTVILSGHKDIFCFGNNHYGQCAIDLETYAIPRPSLVDGDWKENITQISCGSHNTMCTDNTSIWVWGENTHGQCTGNVNDGLRIHIPLKIQLFSNKNISNDSDSDTKMDCEQSSFIVKICSSNFSSFAMISMMPLENYSRLQAMDIPLSIDFKQLNFLCSQIESGKSDEGYLKSILKTIFSSPSCLNQSFGCNRNTYLGVYGSGIDFIQTEAIFDRVAKLGPCVINGITKSMLRLSRKALKYSNEVREPMNLRFYLLILCYKGITNPSFNHIIIQQLHELIERLRFNDRNSKTSTVFSDFVHWIATFDLESRLFFLKRLQDLMSMYLDVKQKIDEYAAYMCDAFLLIWESNSYIDTHALRIPRKKFYSRDLTRSGLLDHKSDYIQWVSKQQMEHNTNINTNNNQIQSQRYRQLFSFCEYPFLFDTVAKRNVIKTEQEITKIRYAQQSIQYAPAALFNNILRGMGINNNNNINDNRMIAFAHPYLIFKVRREHVLQDTLQTIMHTRNAGSDGFYKELKVIFDHEEGVDQGGVRKEFFQLIIKECFKLEYGTFVYNNNTRCYWFNGNAFENPQEFMLLGILIGLAIYNGVLLDIHFPSVVYKKLCSQPLTKYDLYSFDPEIGHSMEQIVKYINDGGDVSDLTLTFSVNFKMWDVMETRDLIEDGRNVMVTNDNIQQYIKTLTEYYLIDSIKDQFEAFATGFKLVVKGKAFGMFNGYELERLICGSQLLDFDALEVSCKYEGGYHTEHVVIRYFWTVLHEFDDNQKRLFLKFFSGSDRAPLRGLGKLGILVQKATEDNYAGEQLPTAHTCFNALLLPAYTTKEIMQRKILIAIQYAEGFGLK